MGNVKRKEFNRRRNRRRVSLSDKRVIAETDTRALLSFQENEITGKKRKEKTRQNEGTAVAQCSDA